MFNLKSFDIIKGYYIDGNKKAILVYESTTGEYYAILNGIKSKNYKTKGRCENYILRNEYHPYVSEKDVQEIRNNIKIIY